MYFPLFVIALTFVSFCYGSVFSHCGSENFQCQNKRCIMRSQWCNKVDDCGDNSDEEYCEIPEGSSLRRRTSKRTCPSNYFRCSDYHCIPQAWVCDGAMDCYDQKDENNCPTGILGLSGVQASRSGGIAWLISKRNSNWGWDENTHRVIVSLYLAGGATFNGTKEDEELMAKQLELKIALSLLRKETDELSENQMALYINALLVICNNPRYFYGYDLVELLKKEIQSKENSTHPVVFLALCNANETISDDAVTSLFSILDYKSEYLFWQDIQAMAMIALSCVTNQDKHAHLRGNLTSIVGSLKRRQRTDGSFGNVYTTALVVQAFLANGQEGDSDWDAEGAVKYLMSKQSPSNHYRFGDLLATYWVLPVLNAKSLTDIAHVKCANNLRRPPRDSNSIYDVKNKVGPKIYIPYSLFVGNKKDLEHSMSLRVPANVTVYDVMRLAAETDAKYKFEYKKTDGQIYIYSISSIANDPETGMFWHLYLSDSNVKLSTLNAQSPDKIILKGNEHVIMWYQSAKIKS